MKKILLSFLFLLILAGSVVGVWYYMNMQILEANTQITALNSAATQAQTKITALETQIKENEAMKLAHQELLAKFDIFEDISASGALQNLESLFDADVKVEGPIAASNWKEYSAELQKYLKTQKQGKIFYPVRLTNGEWSAVVRVSETQKTTPVVLTTSGAIVKTSTQMVPEMVLVLSKWENGKIVEQYEFNYDGDVKESTLLGYISTSSDTEKEDEEASTGTGKVMEKQEMPKKTLPTGTGANTNNDA